MILRRAVAADAAALAVLAESTFVEAFGAQNRPEDLALHVQRSYGEAIQLGEILDPGFVTFVAEGAGQLQAFAQLALGKAPAIISGALPIEIRRFYVDAPWHGRGLAHRLMDAVLDFAAEAGADVVWLGAWERNPRGLAFYAKCGFAPVGHHTFLLGNDPQRDVLMARSADRGSA